MTQQGTARNGDIQLVWEVHGDLATGIPLLLVCGLGQQLASWTPELLAFLTSHGYAVVIADKRDIGLSTHLTDAVPDLLAVVRGTATPPYLLTDMAADLIAVLDAAGVAAAHVAGVSMGGMIAQTLAIEYPQRVLSLTSIMSTTGDRSVGRATKEAAAVLTARMAPDRDAYAENALATARIIGSPGFPRDEELVKARARALFDRSYDPRGVGRQLAAINGSPDRTPALRRLTLPTLVIHGLADPLIDISGGRATAAAVPGATLLEIEGMGHDLPIEVLPQVFQALQQVVARASAGPG
jgi:pimeloyl-ACP methyl ester carboxylesterase